MSFIVIWFDVRTLEQGGEEPPLVLRDDSLLQLERHILQHLARVVGEVQVANLKNKDGITVSEKLCKICLKTQVKQNTFSSVEYCRFLHHIDFPVLLPSF